MPETQIKQYPTPVSMYVLYTNCTRRRVLCYPVFQKIYQISLRDKSRTLSS